MDEIDIEILFNLSLNEELTQYKIQQEIKDLSKSSVKNRLDKLCKEEYIFLKRNNGKNIYSCTNKVVKYDKTKVIIFLPNNTFTICGISKGNIKIEIAKLLKK